MNIATADFPIIVREDPVIHNALPVVTALALSVPLALPAVFNYETNPAFLLAPLIVWAVLTRIDLISGLFVASGICGIISIGIAAYLAPDGRAIKDVLSLVLLMYPVAFFFLGRRIGSLKQFVGWVAIFSSVFLIPVALRVLWLGEPVRLPVDDFLYYNAFWFGWPTFASFGINSGAHLTCIQTALLCGAIMGSGRSRWRTVTFSIAAACGAFLIVGSQSRSAELFLVIFLVGLLVYVWRSTARRPAWLAVVVLVIGIGGGVIWDGGVPRLSATYGQMHGIASGSYTEKLIHASRPPGDNETYDQLDDLSSGRLDLIKLAAQEWTMSPVIGNGFSPFGRYEPVAPGYLLSSTSHVYYLTILWKGGLLFAVPMAIFLGLAAWRMFKRRQWTMPESATSAAAVLLIFGPVSFTYDTPNVPAAGALAYLLLGALNRG